MSELNLKKIIALGTIFSSFSPAVMALQDFSVSELSYQGASRFSNEVSGESRLGYANGTFAINTSRNSIYIVGHSQHQAIAEYKLNGFSKDSNLENIPKASPIMQGFTKILNKTNDGNPEEIDTITGLQFINNDLVVNAATYYNASGSNKDSTLIIRDPTNFSASLVDGYFELTSSVHAAGWMTAIPEALRSEFEADYIFGFASNLPINSRNSMGPSAFAVDSSFVTRKEAGKEIQTTTLLDFSIENPLHPDLYNETGENQLWTEISKAYVGFIVPGTRTYAVFGSSAGHQFGIGYKIQQDDGNVCGGACERVVSDRYNYYWLWDVDKLLAVKNGDLEPHALRPYNHGVLNLPFDGTGLDRTPHLMTAGYFDGNKNNLYLLLGEADSIESKYEPLPILLKFKVNAGKRPEAPTNVKID